MCLFVLRKLFVEMNRRAYVPTSYSTESIYFVFNFKLMILIGSFTFYVDRQKGGSCFGNVYVDKIHSTG